MGPRTGASEVSARAVRRGTHNTNAGSHGRTPSFVPGHGGITLTGELRFASSLRAVQRAWPYWPRLTGCLIEAFIADLLFALGKLSIKSTAACSAKPKGTRDRAAKVGWTNRPAVIGGGRAVSGTLLGGDTGALGHRGGNPWRGWLGPVFVLEPRVGFWSAYGRGRDRRIGRCGRRRSRTSGQFARQQGARFKLKVNRGISIFCPEIQGADMPEADHSQYKDVQGQRDAKPKYSKPGLGPAPVRNV